MGKGLVAAALAPIAIVVALVAGFGEVKTESGPRRRDATPGPRTVRRSTATAPRSSSPTRSRVERRAVAPSDAGSDTADERPLLVVTESGVPVPGYRIEWTLDGQPGGVTLADAEGRLTLPAPRDRALRLSAAAWVGERPAPTDETGRVFLDDLPARLWSVHFDEPGVVPTSARFHVVADRTIHVTLRETRGRTIHLISRDVSGHPLAYARVEVDQPSGVDYVRPDQDEIADLVLWTDSRGHLTLPRVEERDVELAVRYGSRTVEIEVPADETHAEAIFEPVPTK